MPRSEPARVIRLWHARQRRISTRSIHALEAATLTARMKANGSQWSPPPACARRVAPEVESDRLDPRREVRSCRPKRGHGSAEGAGNEGSREYRPADRRIQADQTDPEDDQKGDERLQRTPREVRAAHLVLFSKNGAQINADSHEDQTAERCRRARSSGEEVGPLVRLIRADGLASNRVLMTTGTRMG
jgi:hypothetical protein